jgi:uncharacterized protein (DUF488 family)
MNDEDKETMSIFTVGHSTHPIEKFIDLLKRYDVEAVADVRSSPYSQYNPQYNREVLQKTLQEHAIRYVFLGDELGARRTERTCYVDGQAVYEKVAQLPAFKEGVQRVSDGGKKMRVALMCAEKDPLDCHRTVLVCRQLKEQFSVQHILEDGTAIEHSDIEGQMLEMFDLQGGDLFKGAEQVLDEAYERRGKQIAYTERREEEHGE